MGPTFMLRWMRYSSARASSTTTVGTAPGAVGRSILQSANQANSLVFAPANTSAPRTPCALKKTARCAGVGRKSAIG